MTIAAKVLPLNRSQGHFYEIFVEFHVARVSGNQSRILRDMSNPALGQGKRVKFGKSRCDGPMTSNHIHRPA